MDGKPLTRLLQMLGGMSIQDMLEGLEEEDLRHMPPFPFPEKLFPPGTFPKGMRFSTEFNLPPSVEEALENGDPNVLEKSENAAVPLA